MRLLNLLCLVVWFVVATGCAKYEYNLVQPQDLAAHIGRNTDHVVALPPLEYRLRSYDNRLVMRIGNPTTQPISLLGERSFVVSPRGESHPLRSQTIAPNSYIKQIFPPPRPQYYHPGPSFGVGIGTTVGHFHHHHHRPYYHYHQPLTYREPRYISVYGGADEAFYWDWEGESEASMTLVYRTGSEEFKHEFTFRRQKM
jgi:hypothetical protein